MVSSEKRGHCRYYGSCSGRKKYGKRSLRKHPSLFYAKAGVRPKWQHNETNPEGKSYISGVPVG